MSKLSLLSYIAILIIFIFLILKIQNLQTEINEYSSIEIKVPPTTTIRDTMAEVKIKKLQITVDSVRTANKVGISKLSKVISRFKKLKDAYDKALLIIEDSSGMILTDEIEVPYELAAFSREDTTIYIDILTYGWLAPDSTDITYQIKQEYISNIIKSQYSKGHRIGYNKGKNEGYDLKDMLLSAFAGAAAGYGAEKVF